jgi:RimJ/RimL family protein N-acetyltransferase
MITGSKVMLRDKKLEDAENDYRWEVDSELAHLDAVYPTTISFSEFFPDYREQLRHPLYASRRFALDTLEGRHIGNCSYYNINESRGDAELGIMIGDRDYWDKGYGTDAVATLITHIFQETGLQRIYLKTLEWNERAQNCFQKCGFSPYGQTARGEFSFILMQIFRNEWLDMQQGKADSRFAAKQIM